MRRGRVLRIRGSWAGAVELDVLVEGRTEPALAYPALVGQPETGDEVLLNTTARTLGLGTGGYHLVIADLDRLPDDPVGPGHLVKARYTPLQATVLGVEEDDSPHRDALAHATSVDGMPVVVADLHSALPAILCGARSGGKPLRVAYVMTDGGALPVWFSRTVAALREHEWLVGVITSGQAFGGDLEAVTLHSGLLAARHVLMADLAVVTQGPGNLGAGTPWAFSGVAAGGAVNAVAALAGRAVASIRVTDADPRERHRGLSHHSATAYGRVALAPAAVVTTDLPEPLASEVRADLTTSGISARHHVVHEPVAGLDEALRASVVALSTMGRSYEQDRAYFLTAAAAGRYAAGLADES